MGSRQAIAAILFVVVIAAAGAPRAHAEEHTVQASAAWIARARVFVTGSQQVFVLAVFGGRMAVETEPKTLDGAELLCPGAFDADYATTKQRGEGRCVITTGSGDRLFARWTCAGEPDRGCTGRFALTGGTGAFQGVTGESDFALRLTFSEVIQLDRQESEYNLAGAARWPGLRYQTR